jgi:hypothetical protein
MLDVFSNQLNMKRFQGVLAGNIRECSLKLSIGKPRHLEGRARDGVPVEFVRHELLELLGDGLAF